MSTFRINKVIIHFTDNYINLTRICHIGFAPFFKDDLLPAADK